MANWFDTNKTPNSPMNIAQLMMEQKVQRQSSLITRFNPCPTSIAGLGNASARRVYQPLSMSMGSPAQPNRLLSSQLTPKTMMMLNNHSRLNKLASIATNTSLALELARKKKQQYQQQLLQKRQYQQGLPFRPQQRHQSSGIVTTPSDVDVLLGRGGRSNHHIGNSRFRELIRKNREHYISLPKHEKIKLSRTVVAVVQDLGGRFLELSEDGKYYVVAPNKRAVEKASQCLREKRGPDGHKSMSATAIKATAPEDTTTESQRAGTTSKAA